jgi:hypothetical protein
MGMITLVIKGTKDEARKAAADRGVPLNTIGIESMNKQETVGTVGEYCRPLVEKWFGEPPKEPPFPVGTLLWWSIINNKGG